MKIVDVQYDIGIETKHKVGSLVLNVRIEKFESHVKFEQTKLRYYVVLNYIVTKDNTVLNLHEI